MISPLLAPTEKLKLFLPEDTIKENKQKPFAIKVISTPLCFLHQMLDLHLDSQIDALFVYLISIFDIPSMLGKEKEQGSGNNSFLRVRCGM